MTNVNKKMRFIKFREIYEHDKKKEKYEIKEIWIVTTLDSEVKLETIWKIIHKRWHIENNGFRVLKSFNKFNHCFVNDKKGTSIEVITNFMIIAFNLMQMFLSNNLKDFYSKKISVEHFIDDMKCEFFGYKEKIIILGEWG